MARVTDAAENPCLFFLQRSRSHGERTYVCACMSVYSVFPGLECSKVQMRDDNSLHVAVR